MKTKMELVFTELQLDLISDVDQKLQVLKKWCYEHISQDISYQGDVSESYAMYLALATHYNNFFLAQVPTNLEQLSENQIGLKNTTVIQYAAEHGYDRFIMELTVSQPNVFNIPNTAGMTPLHLAAMRGHIHTLNALIAKGSNPNITNKQRQLPMHTALTVPTRCSDTLISNKETIFRKLQTITSSWLEKKDIYGDTVVHLMTRSMIGKPLFSKLFIEILAQNKSIIRHENNQSHFLIHTAILNRQSEIADALLDVDGVSLLEDSDGRVALHYAAKGIQTQLLIERYIAATPDINCRDRSEKTPLMIAAEAKNITAMDCLIKQGADPTLTDDQGRSILHYATEDQDEILISWILENTSLTQVNLSFRI